MKQLLIVWFKHSIIGKLLYTIYQFLLVLFFRNSIKEFCTLVEVKWHIPSIDLLKTIYFNYRCVNYKDALKMPIYIYKNTILQSLTGHIEFDCLVTSGIVKWGYDYGFRANGKTRIRIEGRIIFKGKSYFSMASNIAVFKYGTLIMGEDTAVWENCLLYCAEKIEIDRGGKITYQSSIMDTDFHYMVNLNDRSIKKCTKPIYIGKYVWVGNRASIKKGAYIPDYTIIASSYTVVSKNYSNIPAFSILGGCPAKVIGSGYVRTWANEKQTISRMEEWFINNIDDKKFFIPENENIEEYYKI